MKGRFVGLFKVGNHKLSESVMIFNMTTATDCPSRAMELCHVGHLCYALPPERIWPAVLRYRKKQAEYWDCCGVIDFVNEVGKVIKNRKYIKYFRFNESGDFRNQDDIARLSRIASILKDEGITTYGYTARRDLDFSRVNFIVRLSGTLTNNYEGCNGKAIVIKKKSQLPKHFHLCPGKGCGKACKFCMQPKGSVVFLAHGVNKGKEIG